MKRISTKALASLAASVAALLGSTLITMPANAGTHCAYEGQLCRFSGVKDVTYGAGHRTVTKRFVNSVYCNNAYFGDPAWGAAKTCQYSEAKGATRKVFMPNYWKRTKHGQAMLANSVKSDVAADIAFAALNDSLTLAATGSMGMVGGFVTGKVITKFTSLFKDNDAQLPRLAKFTNVAATYLQYDDNTWCQIQTGADLAHIERDALEPMERYDIPPGSGTKACVQPDGYYEAGNGNVYRFYSSSPSNKSWYGIGFGDSYCHIAGAKWWLNLARSDFSVSDFVDRRGSANAPGYALADWNNIRQGTKFKTGGSINGLAKGRKYTGLCEYNKHSSVVDIPADKKAFFRTILYNNHYNTSGKGTALYFRAKAGNPLGDALTSDTAGFLAGAPVDDWGKKIGHKVAGKAASKALAFYGTATTILTQFTSGRTSLPKMAKRSNSVHTYLQFDQGQWCYINNPEMLGIMKANTIEVDVNNNLPRNVRPNQIKTCGWPDGFYKTDNQNKVYYLFSHSTEYPTWYGVGFGGRYCAISTDNQWRQLLQGSGSNRHAPQESLHRISNTAFLQYREARTCPTRINNGVASGVR